MKVLKVIFILLAAILMGAVIMFLNEAFVIDTMASSFFIVVNAFLGVDLVSMIKESKALPKTEYKSMHLYRYVLCLIIMLILFGLIIYRKETAEIEALVAMSAFSGGSMIIIGLIITGLESNKIASKSGPE